MAILRGVRLVLGSLTLFAIGWQLRIHAGLGFDVVNFFSYFTNLSNLMAAGVFIAAALRRSAPSARWDLLRLLSATHMVVVGVVFALLLRDQDLGALRPWINVLLHYVMPAAVVLDWWLDPPTRLPRRAPLYALVLPAAYLAYTVLRGLQVGWYPYYFLDPARAGGGSGVALHAVGVALVFLATAWLLAIVARRRT